MQEKTIEDYKEKAEAALELFSDKPVIKNLALIVLALIKELKKTRT